MRVKLFLFGIMMLLLLGCVCKLGEGTQTSTQQAQETEQETTLPTGPRMCVLELPSMRTVETSYDDGAERMRIENRVDNKILITVIKDGYSAAKVTADSPLKKDYPNCDWVITVTNIESVRGGMESLAEIYKKNGSKLTCTPWTVDERMFETPGKVCFGS